MNGEQMKKVFPAYFSNFQLPAAAKEQEIAVYRACRTHKLERESFLCTYEENGFRITAGGKEDDPQEYCMSTYAKLKDVRRFVVADSRYQPPWTLAKGHTTVKDGVSCGTKEWKEKHKSSHVDDWLYEGAEPWTAFELIDYDEEYDEYYCMMDLDEDEVYRILTSRSQQCPYYRQGDDYTLSRRQ